MKIPLQNTRSFGPAADFIAEMSSRRVVDRAFRSAGLSNDVLSGPPIFIPYALQAIFVEDAARQVGAHHLGAILADRYGYRALGRFADYVLEAPRLDAAFARSARAMPFLRDGPAVEIRDAGEHAVLQFDSRLHPLRGAHHVDEGLALLIVDLVRSFHGPDRKPSFKASKTSEPCCLISASCTGVMVPTVLLLLRAAILRNPFIRCHRLVADSVSFV